MKILVADDSHLFRTILNRYLETWGYEVVLATDGYEAQKILDSEDAPRMAILDCEMPGPNGLELCEWIRAHRPDYVYTILLSAADNQRDVIKGFEAGADDYLCKPFEELELRTRLKVGELVVNRQSKTDEARKIVKCEPAIDPLVDAWSRREIIKLADKELSRSRRLKLPLSVLLASLDIEDHSQGKRGNSVRDTALRRTAATIARAVRHFDQVGRYGDEQFLVVLPNCDSTGADLVAGRVRQCFAEKPMISGFETKLNIGITQWHLGQETNDMLHQAESALEQARLGGLNRSETA